MSFQPLAIPENDREIVSLPMVIVRNTTLEEFINAQLHA